MSHGIELRFCVPPSLKFLLMREDRDSIIGTRFWCPEVWNTIMMG